MRAVYTPHRQGGGLAAGPRAVLAAVWSRLSTAVAHRGERLHAKQTALMLQIRFEERTATLVPLRRL